jgi:arginine exporter protein ArgO
MTAAILGGLLAGLGIAMPVGAIGTYLVGLGARAPRSVAAAAALGVASTDGAYAILAVAGGAALENTLEPARQWLRWLSVSALVLLALLTVAAGLRRYRTPGPSAAPRRSRLSAPRAYAALLGLTALNPATLAYFTALVLGTQTHTSASAAERSAFAAAVFVASAAWQLGLVATGAAIGHLAGGRRGRLAIAVASGVVMCALAAKLAA